jgi:hypothetical protein
MMHEITHINGAKIRQAIHDDDPAEAVTQDHLLSDGLLTLAKFLVWYCSRDLIVFSLPE